MFPCQSPQIWSTEDSERLSDQLWELGGKICWTCRIFVVPCESMWYHGPFYWKHCPSLILQEASNSLLSASVESSISASESLTVWTSHSKRWRPCWSKSGDLIFCSPCAVLEPLIPGRSKNFECRTTLKDQHLRFISIPYTVAFNGGNWRRCSVYSNLTSSLDFQPAATLLQAPNILFRKGWEGQSSCCKGSLLPRVSLLYIPSTHTWFLRHTNEAFWTHSDYIDVVCSELESVQQNEQPVRKYAQGNKIYTTLLSCFDWSLLCPSQSAKLKLHEVSEIEIENQKRFEKNWIGCH